MKGWIVYILSDPREPLAVRYVGVTHQSIKARLRCHLHLARQGHRNHLYNWLRKLLRDDVKPLWQVAQTGRGRTWASAERTWIQRYRVDGHRLTNATEGGEGTLGHRHSIETREKMSRSRIGKKLSRETILKMAAGRVGVKQRPETVAKRIISVKATWACKKASGWTPPKTGPERTAKARAAWKGRYHTDSTKRKIGAANKGRKRSLEARLKMSVAKKGKPGRRQSLDTKAKLSIQVKKALARKRQSGWVHPNTGHPRSPEIRAKISATKRRNFGSSD